jgi:hypothetical protein
MLVQASLRTRRLGAWACVFSLMARVSPYLWRSRVGVGEDVVLLGIAATL